MKFIFSKYLIILIILISFISLILNEKLNGVYNINSILAGKKLTLFKNFFIFSFMNNPKYQSFRITPIDSDIYIIESILYKKELGLNDNEELILLDKDKDVNHYWKFISLENEEFLIQYVNTKKYIEFNISYIARTVKCSKTLMEIPNNNINEIKNITSSLKFKFFKLYEEVQIKPEHIKYIEKEPVDVLIKYIDLTDKNLNREGITQIKKDEDHEELRYCVRSILKNIPWIRKIFILMPNEKVSYFKPIEEINDKIVYVKDKDLIGFDSANSLVFQFFLWKMSKFGLSDNFILMDDDYFIGKTINKSEFFYYDEEQKKVLPSIVSDEFSELKRDDILKEYNKYYSQKDFIDPHTSNGWKLHTLSAYKLIIDNFRSPLINAGFTHNAISLNVNDIKEVFELIKNKYQYPNETLYSKTRDILSIQSQTLFNLYSLNIKKRKVNIIPRLFYDLKDLIKVNNIDIELFVINTSGEKEYDKNDYKRLKSFLELKFNKSTPYEIILPEKSKIAFCYDYKLALTIISFFIFITFLYYICIYNKNRFYFPLKSNKKKVYNEEESNLIKKQIKAIIYK